MKNVIRLKKCQTAYPTVSCQVIVDEFEQRIEEAHSKGVADDEVAQKASKVSVTARAARGAKSTKTPGRCYCFVQHMKVSFQ